MLNPLLNTCLPFEQAKTKRNPDSLLGGQVPASLTAHCTHCTSSLPTATHMTCGSAFTTETNITPYLPGLSCYTKTLVSLSLILLVNSVSFWTEPLSERRRRQRHDPISTNPGRFGSSYHSACCCRHLLRSSWADCTPLLGSSSKPSPCLSDRWLVVDLFIQAQQHLLPASSSS